jgi:RNA polymerase sigma factor for flagellar operon FliA
VTEQDLRRESGRSLYDEHRALIDEVAYGTARYHHLSPDAAGDFASFVWQRLLEADTLTRFAGRCSIRTFLTVVIRNLFRDFRNHQWGKWRHSAAARRLGPTALRLEALTVRDGFTFEEALQMITADGRDVVSRPALEDIGRQLPVRVRPRLVSDEALSDLASPSASADDAVERERQAGRAREVRAALSSALGSLPPQDALILRLIFEDGFTVAQVAAAMHLEQKPLYRRRDQLLRTLRSRLQAAGVTASEARDLIGSLDESEPIAPGSGPMDPGGPIVREGA